MSTTSRKGSHGLRVLLEWIRTLDLHRTERDVMFVFAEHSNYWDGSDSRPAIPTVAKKTSLSVRRVQQIVRKMLSMGYLIQTEASRGTLPTTYRLNVKLPISAESTESTEPKSTDLLGVKFSNARGEISGGGGVKFSNARGEISAHAIRKTVSTTVDTTVKAPASAGAAADKTPWEKLVPGLQQRVLREMRLMVEASGNWDDNPGPDSVRGRWLLACQRADIWPHVAEQIADQFYIDAGGRIERDHSPSAFRSPKKKAARGGSQ